MLTRRRLLGGAAALAGQLAAALAGSAGAGAGPELVPNDFPDWTTGVAPTLQQPIGSVQTVGNGDTVTSTFNVPAGCLGVQYISTVQGFAFPNRVTVTGVQTGEVYIDDQVALGASTGADMSRFIPPDTQVQCSVTSSAGAGTAAFVTFLALRFPPTVNVRAAGGVALPVTAAGSLSAPWQAPRSKLVGTVGTAAATYAQILAPVGAGVQLYLFWAVFYIDAASGGVFAVSTDGVSANVFVVNDNGKGPYVLGPFGGGRPEGFNAALKVFTTLASTVRFSIAYTAA